MNPPSAGIMAGHERRVQVDVPRADVRCAVTAGMVSVVASGACSQICVSYRQVDTDTGLLCQSGRRRTRAKIVF
jgi:hypothetical protein